MYFSVILFNKILRACGLHKRTLTNALAFVVHFIGYIRRSWCPISPNFQQKTTCQNCPFKLTGDSAIIRSDYKTYLITSTSSACARFAVRFQSSLYCDITDLRWAISFLDLFNTFEFLRTKHCDEKATSQIQMSSHVLIFTGILLI